MERRKYNEGERVWFFDRINFRAGVVKRMKHEGQYSDLYVIEYGYEGHSDKFITELWSNEIYADDETERMRLFFESLASSVNSKIDLIERRVA